MKIGGYTCNISGERWYRPLVDYCLNPHMFNGEVKDEQSKKILRAVAARNMFVRSVLSNVLCALNSMAIDVLVLKGSHIEQIIYPAGIRPVGDIDLLIKRKQSEAVLKELKKLSFSADTKGMPLWMQQDVAGRVSFRMVMHTDIPLDIHYTLGPYPYLGKLDTEELWKKSYPAVLAGQRTAVMCNEHTLVHLCLHMVHHANENWIVSACDIASIIRCKSFTVNWDMFADEIKRLRLELPVIHSFKTVNGVFGLRPPERVIDMLGSVQISLRERIVFKLSSHKQDKYAGYLLQFLTTPGLKVKIACLLRVLFPYSGVLSESTEGTSGFKSYLCYYLNLLKSALTIFSSLLGRRA